MPSVLETPALDRLRPEEQAEVLGDLLRRDPERRGVAEQAAMALLRDVSAHDVAEQVSCRLMALGLEDLAARAGRVPGGYVHETDAACQLIEESLAPVEADLRRCIELDLQREAEQTLLGLVVALHRCARPLDGTVLAYAGPDTPAEHAAWMVTQAARSGIELNAGDIEELCPGWHLTAAGLHWT